MKNFKRVISAVIALAISVSSFAAVSAAKFTDVADTASYAEAVEVLSALGIVNGYEDGSFKPDGEITRAEAATMIVGALNMTEDAKASAGTSKFADVNTDASWAAGYVNVGVAQGFIAGMNDTTFAPKDNVTYAQMCVMLTKITGYGDYAAANSTVSDWSAGYTAMAASVGINKGVQVSKDTKLTRAQVAQMLYNALLTPQLGVTEYTFSGNTYSQLDGKQNRDFKTLLSDKFDGYQITGMITKTSKTDTGLDNDEIKVKVEKADWWPDNKASITNGTSEYTFISNGIDADSVLFQSGKAIFITNEYDEKVLVYFASTGKTEVKEFDAADYVSMSDLSTANKYQNETDVTKSSEKIKFGSKYYTMVTKEGSAAKDVSLYVNGVEYTKFNKNTNNVNDLLDRFIGDAQGTVTLIKGENDNGYSSIFVNYYETAEVASVSYKTNKTTIDFTVPSNATTIQAKKLVINDDAIEDGDIDVAVYMGDKEIGLNDIQEDDIIAIKTDVSLMEGDREIGDQKAMKFIEILVSRDSVSGKLTSINDDDKEITIDSKAYSAVNFAELKRKSEGTNPDFEIGDIYKVTLDAFGRIYDYETTESTKNYAILEKYNENSDTITLVLGDGSYKAYDFTGIDANTIKGILYESGTTKKAVKDRIVEYTIKSSTGAVSSLTPVTPQVGTNAEYNARTGKVGSFAVSESTKVLDASSYDGQIGDYKKMAVSSFTDGAKYDVYAVNKTSSFYSFILVTKNGDKIGANSRFAVARGTASKGVSKAGDECINLDVLYNGEEQKMDINNTVNVYVNGAKEVCTSVAALNGKLAQTSAFFFETDSDNLVTDIYVVYANGALVAKANMDAGTDVYDNTKWAFGLQNPTKLDMQIAYGIITDRGSDSVDLGVVKNDLIDKNIADDQNTLQGVYNFKYAKDCVAYTYDLSDSSTKVKDKIYAESSAAAIKASNFKLFEDADDSEKIHWSTNYNGNDINDYANYALVQLVDDEVVAIYEIIR